MPRTFIALLITLHLSATAQDSFPEVIVLAEITDIESTGKRHNSFYFTFKVLDVVEGELKDSTIRTQEIFSDFGGKQTMIKLYPKTYARATERENEKPQQIYLKLRVIHSPGDWTAYEMLWACNQERLRTMQELEELLTSFHQKDGVPFRKEIMLQERAGRCFFVDSKDEPHMAMETFPNSKQWVIGKLVMQSE